MNRCTFKQITFDQQKKLNDLIDTIEKSMQDKNWFLPIEQTAKQNFFNPNWTYFLGCYDNEKLIGASALFFNEFEWGYSASNINMQGKIAEIGRSMVMPEYRNQNIMFELNKRLLTIAKYNNIQNLIATVHPDNIASRKSLKKLGFEKKNTIIKNGYIRDVMQLSL